VGRRRVRSTPGHPVKSTANKKDGYGSITTRPGEIVNYGDADGCEEVKEWRCVEGCPVAELDRQSGELKSGEVKQGYRRGEHKGCSTYGEMVPGSQLTGFGDTGTASRFFYQPEWGAADYVPFRYEAKASTAERNAGCEEFYWERTDSKVIRVSRERYFQLAEKDRSRGNLHPTVKPVELMRYLIKLFIGKGHVVLDPFLGSGTTHIAADLEGVKCIGIDAEKEYCEIAHARVIHWRKYKSEYLTTGQIPVVKDAAMPLFDNGSDSS